MPERSQIAGMGLRCSRPLRSLRVTGRDARACRPPDMKHPRSASPRGCVLYSVREFRPVRPSFWEPVFFLGARGSPHSERTGPCRLVVPAALVAGRASVGLRAGVMRRPDASCRAGRCRSSERQPFADWRSREGHEKFRVCAGPLNPERPGRCLCSSVAGRRSSVMGEAGSVSAPGSLRRAFGMERPGN